jgi:chromosome segregation ATPase
MKSIFSIPLLVAALAAPHAWAQPKNVSRDELRVCMNSESDLATRRQGLEARGKKGAEERAAIKAEAEELTAERKAAEEDSRRIDRVERKVRVHNQRIKTANEAVAALAADVDQLNKDMTAHNQKCGGIAFDPDDKAAILKEREAAAKK